VESAYLNSEQTTSFAVAWLETLTL